MSQAHHRGSMLPQETNFDNADQPGIAQPISQNEIEDLLFGDDRALDERLARLREMRAELAARESADWGDEDPLALLSEVERAIDTLGGDAAAADDGDAYAGLAPALDRDPGLDSLSPDDTEARQAIEGEPEPVYLDDVDEAHTGLLDESRWDDGPARR